MGTKSKQGVKQRGGITRFPTTKRSMTEAAQARVAAMNACTPVVTQAEIVNECVRREIDIARASVGFILHGAWWNRDVGRVFCDLTGTKMATMWPEWVDERGNDRKETE